MFFRFPVYIIVLITGINGQNLFKSALGVRKPPAIRPSLASLQSTHKQKQVKLKLFTRQNVEKTGQQA
jgi:hypothetical protein